MMRRSGIAILFLLIAIGCVKSEVTEADSAKVHRDFSQASYEEAMKAAGKEKELEEEKARWAAHEAANGGASPAVDQGG